MSMTTFQAHKFGYIIPKDDDARFTKEVEILDDAKMIKLIMNPFKIRIWQEYRIAANTFAIVCLCFCLD